MLRYMLKRMRGPLENLTMGGGGVGDKALLISASYVICSSSLMFFRVFLHTHASNYVKCYPYFGEFSHWLRSFIKE